mgnify:FL=1
MKKNKSIITNIICSVVFLAIIYVLIGKVYSITVNYSPSSKAEFMKASPEDILGKSIDESTGSFWDSLDKQGQLGCFHHQATGGMSNKINSIYDIGFNTNKGVMQIYSIMDTSPRKSMTSYAGENNPTVGKLIAEATRSGNATGVQRALAAAIQAGTVVKETAVGLNEEWVDSENHASTEQINLYNNYREINKVSTGSEAKEKSDTITINKEEYTVVGPLKMSFGGKGIASITASSAKWTSTSSKDIYWSKSATASEKDWSNDFNKTTSGKYKLDGMQFYIAIQTSKLPDSGKYNVIIKQEKFKYYTARIAVCLLPADGVNVGQQTGFYCYANDPQTVEGEISWTIKRNATKTLEIDKKDKKTGKDITGAKFKIYAELKNGTKGWVSGDAAGTKTYGETATEYDAKVSIKSLKFGTYYIYETAVPDGYDMTEQEGYHKEAKGSSSLTGDWVYLGEQVLSASTKENNGKVEFNATNVALAKLKIVKKDATKDLELQGGGFKIYAVLKNGTKGWVSGDVAGTKTYGETATEYTSSTVIEKLKYGTYYIYETKGPEGYDLTKQDGYHKEAEGSSSLTGDWVYLGSQELNVDSPDDEIFKFNATNKKIISGLEGKVWVDEPDQKLNTRDNIYKENTNDKLKEGIKVNLYDGTGKLLATTKTNEKGEYKFTTKTETSGDDKNIYYWDLIDAYVEFEYNNKTEYDEKGNAKENEYGYIAVDPFVGDDSKINSKAQEYTVTKEDLDDRKLTGTEGENPGRAVTNKNASIKDINKLLEINSGKTSADLKDLPLAGYYDNKTFKVSDINLGLHEQYDADYLVDENLAYIKIKMKGYTYTYKYGAEAATTSQYVPTAHEQNTTRTFTGKIYPTDIAYNVETNTDELKVYAIYSIDIKNLEKQEEDDTYVEKRLYLEKLENKYDTDRFELSTDENNDEHKSDFKLWSDSNGTASYDINNENSVYRNGIGTGEQDTVTSYIQFRVKDEAVKQILNRNIPEEQLKKAASVTTAEGYHEYLRTDNAWVHSDDVRAFEGVKGINTYPIKNTAGNKYYVHRTISKARTGNELYLRFELGEERTLSGTVFEDTKTEESEKENTSLGNGRIDENEKNIAKGVKVELLEKNSNGEYNVTSLYRQKEDKSVEKVEAVVNATDDKGEYTFKGVVPGYYYIRFTYGDGSQKMLPANSDILSNDYKSTIINTEESKAGTLIKNAMEASNETISNAQQALLKNQNDETSKKLLEWYKYLSDAKYSVATDDLTQRAKLDKYTYKQENGKTVVYDENNNKVEGYMLVNALSPITGISIENDVNDSADVKVKDGELENTQKPYFSGFNFGIIKQAKTEVTPDKKITNVKFTSQTGTTLVSANPTDKTSTYLTALDKIDGGSKYAKLELEQSLIYGSALETTYEIVVKNTSEKDYIEEEGTNEYGTYYKYGEISKSSRLKHVTVNEIVDELDTKYNYDAKQDSINSKVEHLDKSVEERPGAIKVTKKQNDDGSSETQTTSSLSITGWETLTTGEQETISYTVTSLLSSDDDTDYKNTAKITSITLDKLTGLRSDFVWISNDASTSLVIAPPTGSDRRNTYWIAGTIGLIVVATGIVFIKKKMLNK